MFLNVRRKVGEINLKPSEYLLPLFEVIVNAIHAIEARGKTSGLIEIEIIRDESQPLLDDGFERKHPITSFIVKDNGVGFGQKEFGAFDDGYTDYKLTKGGKGVGRFTVLSAFDLMEIESCFLADGKIYERRFTFSINDEIKEIEKPKESDAQETGTIVRLKRYKTSFLEKSSVSVAVVCDEIVNNLLVFFLTNNMPKVLVKDEGVTRDLAVFYQNFLSENKIDKIKINEVPFKFYFLKRLTSKETHQIYLCAHNRLVKIIPIKKLVPNLYKPITENGQDFVVSIFVTSNYLDNNLNELRNTFTFANKTSEKDGDYTKNISLEEIEDAVTKSVNNEYSPLIIEVEKDKLKKISEFVLSEKGIEYRHLLDEQNSLSSISPENLSSEKLDAELHHINYQLEKKHKADVAKILSKSVDNTEEYHQELHRVLIDEKKFSQSKLANYVIHRNVILKVFDKFLEWDEENSKYRKEEDLHNIIFPMGGDNDIVPFNKHNLWLLDERLTFHTYAASDKGINTLKTVDSDSRKEGDLIIFDKRWVYSPDDEFSSLVIFEFKRPGLALGDNIEKQVLEYFQKIVEGNSKTYKGKIIEVDDNTPKFGYIVCEIPKSLRENLIKWQGYKETPNQTLFKYLPDVNMYLEVMSFHHIHKSATERHKAFFRMLGIDK